MWKRGTEDRAGCAWRTPRCPAHGSKLRELLSFPSSIAPVRWVEVWMKQELGS